jgi:hypothetical protein
MIKQNRYLPIKVTRKTGSERLHNDGKEIPVQLVDFWRWSASDLLRNTTRGVFAEFIIASALGLAHSVRSEWDSYDLITQKGKRIEVKSAAYLQSWSQKKLSTITFSIRASRKWNPDTGELDNISERQADIYVFCLLDHQDQKTVDPMNLTQWRFFIINVDVLNQHCPGQKTISLTKLLGLKPFEVTYEGISDCINQII